MGSNVTLEKDCSWYFLSKEVFHVTNESQWHHGVAHQQTWIDNWRARYHSKHDFWWDQRDGSFHKSTWQLWIFDDCALGDFSK